MTKVTIRVKGLQEGEKIIFSVEKEKKQTQTHQKNIKERKMQDKKNNGIIGFNGTLSQFQVLLAEKKDEVFSNELAPFIRAGVNVNGLDVRGATAVVLYRSRRIYSYRRTPATQEQGTLRGISGKLDTPIGVVPWVGDPKFGPTFDLGQINGEAKEILWATEENLGYGEFAFMPVIPYRVTKETVRYLTAHQTDVHDKLNNVSRYQWIYADTVMRKEGKKWVRTDEAQTKIYTAARWILENDLNL